MVIQELEGIMQGGGKVAPKINEVAHFNISAQGIRNMSTMLRWILKGSGPGIEEH